MLTGLNTTVHYTRARTVQVHHACCFLPYKHLSTLEKADHNEWVKTLKQRLHS